jgi:hypothetical protein
LSWQKQCREPRFTLQDVGASFAVGAVGSVAYLHLLNKSIDGLGGTSELVPEVHPSHYHCAKPFFSPENLHSSTFWPRHPRAHCDMGMGSRAMHCLYACVWALVWRRTAEALLRQPAGCGCSKPKPSTLALCAAAGGQRGGAQHGLPAAAAAHPPHHGDDIQQVLSGLL